MTAINYQKTDAYYEFEFEAGVKALYPVSAIVLVDDESGLISVKDVATNKTIFLVRK